MAAAGIEAQPLADGGMPGERPMDAGGTPDRPGAADGLPLVLEHGDFDPEAAPALDGEPAAESTKTKGLFSKLRRKGKAQADGEQLEGANGDGVDDQQQEEVKPVYKATDKSLDAVLSSLMHEPGTLKPASFASNRTELVKERQRNKGKHPKLRSVFARELPFYQTSFKDSDKPCVGVAPQKKCRVNPTFAAHMDWSVRAACAATLAAAPSFYPTITRRVEWEKCHDSLYECSGWAQTSNAADSPCIGDNMNFMKSVCPYSCREFEGYEECNQDMGWTPSENWVPDLDPSYAAVVCILTFGYTIGETTRYFFELFAGVIAAAIIPQIAVLTFGATWQASAIFLFFYTILAVCMPVDNMTKKFTLALCVKYMCTRALWESRGWYWTDHWVTYHVAKMGCFGAFCALLFQFLIPWRYAHQEAHRCLQSVGSDITVSLSHMVQGFCEGQTKQERTKALRYTDHITRQLMQLEQFCTFAWWEPGFYKTSPQTKTFKYKVCAATMHKCRANLSGMQQALAKWENEENRVALEDFKATLLDFATASMETLDGLLHFMCEGELPVHFEEEVEHDDSTKAKQLWSTVRRKITHREKIERDIKKHIPGYEHLERQMRAVHFVYSDLRDALKNSREDGNRLEEDEQLHLFLMSLTSFGQALLSFPEEYAEMHEARHNESKSDDFIPEAKLVTIFFQRRHLIAAVKTAVGVTLAFLVNVWLFDFEWLAPVAISYVMAGHHGGSYANTASRGLGVLIGMIISFTLIIITSCEPLWMAFAYFLVILGGSYARISSPTATYTALVSSIVSSQLMVAECTTEMDLQFAMARQLVLAVFVMAAAEIFYVPFPPFTLLAPTNSLYYLRSQVADTLLETRVVFLEIFQTHLSDCWANIERKAYVANQFAQGRIEEYKPDTRLSKLVDNSLWRNLPIYLNSQEVLMEQCWNEPSFWRPPFPKTAYDQLISLNRQSVLFLTVLQNHLSESDRKRGETRQLIDEARKELSELRDSLVDAMDELAFIIRGNQLNEEMRSGKDGEPVGEYDLIQTSGKHGSRHLAPSKSLHAIHRLCITTMAPCRPRSSGCVLALVFVLCSPLTLLVALICCRLAQVQAAAEQSAPVQPREQRRTAPPSEQSGRNRRPKQR
jgi:hypothetical protein